MAQHFSKTPYQLDQSLLLTELCFLSDNFDGAEVQTSRLEDITTVAILKIFPCNTKTTKYFENSINKSDTTIRILPFLPICKEIGQLSRAFSLFSLEKGLELVMRFCWELKQNKILAMANSSGPLISVIQSIKKL